MDAGTRRRREVHDPPVESAEPAVCDRVRPDGDDPAECGDYDGDGITDAAVFRDVDLGTNPAHTLIHPSSGAPDRN